MHVLRLLCSASVTSVLREAIALQHGHMLKVIGENAGSRQARHPGSDHDRLPAYKSRCHRRLPSCLYIPGLAFLSADCQMIFGREPTGSSERHMAMPADNGWML